MSDNQVYIQCEILSVGMFPNEKLVSITTVDDGAVSALVDQSLLKERGSEIFLNATLMKQKHEISVCLLPVELDSGSRWVRINNNMLLTDTQELLAV